MSDLTPEQWAERQRVAMDARMDRWAAHLREVLRRSLGLGPERAPWEDTNDTKEAP